MEETTAPVEPMDPAVEEASCTAPAAPDLEFMLVLGKSNQAVSRPADSTIGQLRAEIEARLEIPAGQLKLLCAGKALKDDAASIQQAGIKKGSKVMLLGTRCAALP